MFIGIFHSSLDGNINIIMSRCKNVVQQFHGLSTSVFKKTVTRKQQRNNSDEIIYSNYILSSSLFDFLNGNINA